MRDTAPSGPHPVDVHVGRRLAERRLLLGYNQSQLAQSVGLSFQQVQKYEKGTNRVSASKLWTMANFLDVPISYFFEGLDGAKEGELAAQDGPLTRDIVEIQRLVQQLSRSQQRLVVNLVRNLTAAHDE